MEAPQQLERGGPYSRSTIRKGRFSTGKLLRAAAASSPGWFTAPAISLHFPPEQSKWSVTRCGERRRGAPLGSPAGLGLVAPGSSGAAPGAPNIALSDTALRVLTEAGQQPLRLVTPPKHLPTAACNAVLRSLLKQGYVEECAAPIEDASLGWRQQDGTCAMVRATDAGLHVIGFEASAAVGSATTAVDDAELGGRTHADYDAGQEAAQRALGVGIDLVVPDVREQAIEAGIVSSDAAQESRSGLPAASAIAEVYETPNDGDATQHASTVASAPIARITLRDAAYRVLTAWDDEAHQRDDLAAAMAALRGLLTRRIPAFGTTGPRKRREGTKQQQVLGLLGRREGATVAQIAEATGWQAHTVRGFFAGLKKKGIEVGVLERVRQVGANKAGAKGSYTIYRIAEAG